MNPRSKKYYESRKAQKGDNKGSATKSGYDEQNEKTSKEPKENPAPQKSEDQPKVEPVAEQDDTAVPGNSNENVTAEQDDTAGPNNSGERSDEN